MDIANLINGEGLLDCLKIEEEFLEFCLGVLQVAVFVTLTRFSINWHFKPFPHLLNLAFHA